MKIKVKFLKNKGNFKKGEVIEIDNSTFDFWYFMKTESIEELKPKKGKKKNESV